MLTNVYYLPYNTQQQRSVTSPAACAQACSSYGASCASYIVYPLNSAYICYTFPALAAGSTPTDVEATYGSSITFISGIQTVNGFASIPKAAFTGANQLGSVPGSDLATCRDSCNGQCTFAVFDANGNTCTQYSGNILSVSFPSSTATTFFRQTTSYPYP